MASSQENDFETSAKTNVESAINKKAIVHQFKFLEKVSEHHNFFAKDPIQKDQSYLKVIKKEISILQHFLPQGIFVKAFENRSDLFSAMIEGPENTPYEGGLFFFEIQLPSDYPHSPPKFHYQSYNEPSENCRINPNLYAKGCVCLSILGTYNDGPRWDPKNSSLLQVLVSIQGLILVQEPFWNEPNRLVTKYDNQDLEGLGIHFYTNKSEKTNRNILMLVFKALETIIKNTPIEFENEIRQHFASSYYNISQKLRLWMNQSEEDIGCNDASTKFVPPFPIACPDKTFIRDLNGLLDHIESTVKDKYGAVQLNSTQKISMNEYSCDICI